MSTVTVASLFSPPDGFLAPQEPDEAVRFSLSYEADLQRWWRECPRADWMLWIAGHCRLDRRWAVRAALRCVRLGTHALNPDDHEAVQLLERIDAWSRAPREEQREWGPELDRDYLGSGEVAGHCAQASIAQLASVARYGPTLGLELPYLLQQTLVFMIRSHHSQGMWLGVGDRLEQLRRCADLIREEVPGSIAALMVLPDAREVWGGDGKAEETLEEVPVARAKVPTAGKPKKVAKAVKKPKAPLKPKKVAKAVKKPKAPPKPKKAVKKAPPKAKKGPKAAKPKGKQPGKRSSSAKPKASRPKAKPGKGATTRGRKR